MTQVDSILEWNLTVPIEKSERSDGRWIIRGVAAGAGFVDKDGDQMMPQAIEMLAAQINTSPVPFRNWHKDNDILEDLGEVVKATVTPDFQLEVEVELDQENPQAEYLWKKLGKGKKYGMSVRGDSERPAIERGEKQYISKHHTVHLKEVSVTTKPYYTHSLGTVLRKAIDEAGLAPLANTGENTTMADSIKGETSAQESSAPENDTAAEATSPSQELVKSLMADEGFTTLIASTVREAVAASAQASEDSVEDSTEISKADEGASAPDITEIVKSLTTELNDSMDKKIESMLDRIADAAGPRVLTKSESEEAAEAIEAFKNADPRERLRVGLAAKHDELSRL